MQVPPDQVDRDSEEISTFVLQSFFFFLTFWSDASVGVIPSINAKPAA